MAVNDNRDNRDISLAKNEKKILIPEVFPPEVFPPEIVPLLVPSFMHVLIYYKNRFLLNMRYIKWDTLYEIHNMRQKKWNFLELKVDNKNVNKFVTLGIIF